MDALMNLSLEQLVGRAACIIAVVSIFVEITPIKINPISHILKWVGHQLNKDVMVEIDKLEKKVDVLEKADVVQSRVRILNFADEIRRGVRHSKESFDQALSDIDTYDIYCAEHPKFPNNRTIAAKNKILEVYSACIDNNDFL